ncbi:MAG: substrate-binding domain-containing protein [Chakrabartia sp.]
MKNSTKAFAAIVAVSIVAVPAWAQMRRNIRIVGSSTVYPFATAVAERFSRTNPGVPTPVVESTGTGAGMKLFCAGIGAGHPDITNASRRIKASEFKLCAANGVTQITEVQVGLDGLALATGERAPTMALSTRDIYVAVAKTPFGKPNTTKTWKDVNPKLPATPIRIYGPPSTSGTRDSLVELMMKPGCDTNGAMPALKKTNEAKYNLICGQVRSDGAYIDAGENDNLIVQKLAANPGTVGIMGYSYVEENPGRLNPVVINGVAPNYGTISSFKYPGARPLYIYIKNQHAKAIPGIRAFVAEFARETTWGARGYLVQRGMIASPDATRARYAKLATTLTPMTAAGLK